MLPFLCFLLFYRELTVSSRVDPGFRQENRRPDPAEPDRVLLMKINRRIVCFFYKISSVLILINVYFTYIMNK